MCFPEKFQDTSLGPFKQGLSTNDKDRSVGKKRRKLGRRVNKRLCTTNPLRKERGLMKDDDRSITINLPKTQEISIS